MTFSVGGSKAVTCGGGCATVTVAVLLIVPSVAVMVARPVALPMTVNVAVSAFAWTVTVGGMVNSAGLFTVRAISVGVVCCALIETVSEPVALTTIDCVGGCSAVSWSAGGMTSTAAVELELFRLAVTIVVPRASPVTENVAWV